LCVEIPYMVYIKTMIPRRVIYLFIYNNNTYHRHDDDGI
jgi:hypothetical protein